MTSLRPTGCGPGEVRTERHLDTDPHRIRRDLGFIEVVTPLEGLERTVAWERVHPPDLGLDYAAEDAILAEVRGG